MLHHPYAQALLVVCVFHYPAFQVEQSDSFALYSLLHLERATMQGRTAQCMDGNDYSFQSRGHPCTHMDGPQGRECLKHILRFQPLQPTDAQRSAEGGRSASRPRERQRQGERRHEQEEEG